MLERISVERMYLSPKLVISSHAPMEAIRMLDILNIFVARTKLSAFALSYISIIGSNKETTVARSPPKMTSELVKPEIIASDTLQNQTMLFLAILFMMLMHSYLECRNATIMHHIDNFLSPRTLAGAPIWSWGEKSFLNRVTEPPAFTM